MCHSVYAVFDDSFGNAQQHRCHVATGLEHCPLYLSLSPCNCSVLFKSCSHALWATSFTEPGSCQILHTASMAEASLKILSAVADGGQRGPSYCPYAGSQAHKVQLQAGGSWLSKCILHGHTPTCGSMIFGAPLPALRIHFKI